MTFFLTVNSGMHFHIGHYQRCIIGSLLCRNVKANIEDYIYSYLNDTTQTRSDNHTWRIFIAATTWELWWWKFISPSGLTTALWVGPIITQQTEALGS